LIISRTSSPRLSSRNDILVLGPEKGVIVVATLLLAGRPRGFRGLSLLFQKVWVIVTPQVERGLVERFSDSSLGQLLITLFSILNVLATLHFELPLCFKRKKRLGN
jgi:hypothetical protein